MQVEVEGPVGKLVGTLEEPEVPPRGVGLVCHPHPMHGGSQRNAIVVRVARALRATGLVTLRFNFRGVEGSDGVHDGTQEIEDAAAAARFLLQGWPDLPLWVGGYSFGSRVSGELALRDDAVERLVMIAFPASHHDPGFLARVRQPGLLVMGESDPFGTAAGMRKALPKWPAHLEIQEIAGADHFFRGRTPLVEEAVLRYAQAAFEEA